jgi:DNA-binding CsgD family transcriptional regulator
MFSDVAGLVCEPQREQLRMAGAAGPWDDPSNTLKDATSSLIDLVEVAYDLEKPDSEWLQSLIDAGAPILDQGLGIFAIKFMSPPPDGGGAQVAIDDVYLHSIREDYPKRFDDARMLIPPGIYQKLAPPGFASTWSEMSADYPQISIDFLRVLGHSDVLGIHASDPNGVGILINAPLAEAGRLTPRARERWQMLGAHIASAFRLRQGLKSMATDSSRAVTHLPRNAEAVFDIESFRTVDQIGRAEGGRVLNALRTAARTVDEARGALRRDDPEKALDIWKVLVSGRWSMVDWFDTDGRRFVLAIPNSPELSDPRGLTEQESQVVSYLLLGDTNKLIAYRLGLSASRVSGLLKSAMSKLGVTSKIQLLEKLGPLVVHGAPDDGASAG